MGMFDSAIDSAMAKAGPMFDKLVQEFEAVRSNLQADTTQDAQVQQTNEALMHAVEALTAQTKALRVSIQAANKLAQAHPSK